MKKLALAGALALAVALGGCATIIDDINKTTAALSSPAANQAAANLKAGAAAVMCAVANVASVIKQIETDATIPSKYAAVIVRDTKTVYAVSSDACAFFGGTSQGAVTVPAGAGTPVVPATP